MMGTEEDCRELLLGARVLPSSGTSIPVGVGMSVASLRTTALHLYAWRVTETPDSEVKFPSSLGPAAKEIVDTRAADERQAEALLARALELEPLHLPTLAALAFMVLQRGSSGGASGGGDVTRAEELLEKAVEYGGRRAPSDVFRTLAQIRVSQGRRSSAVSLFHRAAAAGRRAGDDDPLALLGLARLLLAPSYHQHLRCAAPFPSADRDANFGVQKNGAALEDRPETEIPKSPLPIDSKTAGVPPTETEALPQEAAPQPLEFPNVEDRSKAARLLAQAFASVGGKMPPEDVCFGGQTDDRPEVGDAGGVGAFGNADGPKGRRPSTVLADVHLVMSHGTCRRRSGFPAQTARPGSFQGVAQDKQGDIQVQKECRMGAQQHCPHFLPARDTDTS
ncbi:unnamed protein product [Scytosiphon promiscuus]